MKFKFYGKSIVAGFMLAFALLSFACQSATNQTTDTQEAVKAQSPREAYKLLFEAVKAKKPERVKQMISNNTLTFAGIASQQQNQSLEKVLENGFTATTFANSLPESRDQRVNGNFGAVEVFNQTDNRWEDLPFVLEDGGWKLAVGDAFNGNYKSPGKGQAQLEMEAANPAMKSDVSVNDNANTPPPNAKTGATDKPSRNRVGTAEVPDESGNKAPAKENKK